MKRLYKLITLAVGFGTLTATWAADPQPLPAKQKTVFQCSDSASLPTPKNQPIILNNSWANAKVIHGSTISLARGENLVLSQDTTLLATDDIVISGNIKLTIAQAKNPTPRLRLISLNGAVKIEKFAIVGGGWGEFSRDIVIAKESTADAGSGPGTNAGAVELNGNTIEILGHVNGMSGGHSGKVIATTDTATGRKAKLLKALGIGGRASAVSGEGGHGGDVLLCAREGVIINSGSAITPATVVAGTGGDSGMAIAVADSGKRAYARSGNANSGGDVVIVGTLPGNPVNLHNDGFIGGGAGGYANLATAEGGKLGGKGEARGGNGGAGGKVIFKNVAVTKQGRIAAGDGEVGADATAKGYDGRNEHILRARNGGDAKAVAGDGGAPGTQPQVPLLQGSAVIPTPGIAGASGSGGNAEATPGSGGAGKFFIGAKSGSAHAEGGANGSGVKPAPPNAPVGGGANTAAPTAAAPAVAGPGGWGVGPLVSPTGGPGILVSQKGVP